MNALGLLFFLGFLVSVDLRIIGPVMPSVAESLRATPGAIGLAMTAYGFAYGAGQFVYGPLSDRHGRVAVVRVAALGFGACTALSGLCVTTGQFVAARLLAGAFAGSVIPLTLVHIGDTVDYARRHATVARFSVVTSAGFAFSAAIGGMVAHFVSWRAMLIGYALLALAPAALLWRVEPGPPPKAATAEPAVSYADFLRDPFARRVYAGILAESFLLSGALNYLGAYAFARYQINQLEVGLLLALFGVGTMAGGVLMAPLRRYLSERGLAGWGGALMGVALLLLLIPAGGWPLFAAAMLLLGWGFVGLHTTLQVYGTEISRAARGKAFSLFPASLSAGAAAGTAAMGPLVDAGAERVMLVICGAGLIVVGVATAYIRRRRSA